jgi:hypothetical protein
MKKKIPQIDFMYKGSGMDFNERNQFSFNNSDDRRGYT